jgi:hypothetical protein
MIGNPNFQALARRIARPVRLVPNPKFPPSRWANMFAQLVGPLITEITCLRSHELKVFHLVSAHVGSPPGELRPNRRLECAPTAGTCGRNQQCLLGQPYFVT